MIYSRAWYTKISKGVEKGDAMPVTDSAKPNDSTLWVWRVKTLQTRFLVHLKAVLFPSSVSDLTSYNSTLKHGNWSNMNLVPGLWSLIFPQNKLYFIFFEVRAEFLHQGPYSYPEYMLGISQTRLYICLQWRYSIFLCPCNLVSPYQL